MARVLIVDDQERIARAVSILLEIHGFEADTADEASAARALAAEGSYDLVIQDMNFTPGRTDGKEGLELFRHFRRAHPELPVLLMTAWGSVDAAVRLMREGAADYLEKPWDDERLIDRVRELIGTGRTSDVAALEAARHELRSRYDLGGLVYASAAMHEAVTLALRVAKADVPVLITGRNGTGKERIAELIQANSPRRGQPFVKVNAGALPETLLEAELFGADAGAFTGAGQRRRGRFEAAAGGTLLLDEIGNLPLAGQMKLLRVLESGEFERLGSSRTLHADVRVLAATNSDLEAAIREGSFREDLFYRLNVIEIEVPPLVERPEDIPLLAEHFLDHLGAQGDLQGGAGPPGLGAEARRVMLEHGWPGNVRELRNRIQRALLVAGGGSVEPRHLGLGDGGDGGRSPARIPRDASGSEPAVEPPVEDPERGRLERVLAEHGGVVSRAAAALGISRQALYRRMEKLGIVMERRPRA